jgi:hypothetical protein
VHLVKNGALKSLDKHRQDIRLMILKAAIPGGRTEVADAIALLAAL